MNYAFECNPMTSLYFSIILKKVKLVFLSSDLFTNKRNIWNHKSIYNTDWIYSFATIKII